MAGLGCGVRWGRRVQDPGQTLITAQVQCPHLHSRGGGEDQGFSDLFLSRGCFVQRKPEAVGQPGRWMKTRGSAGVSTGRGGGCRPTSGAPESGPCREPTPDPEPGCGNSGVPRPRPQALGRGNSVGGTAGLTGPPGWGSQSSAAGTAGSGPRHQARGRHRSAAFAPAAVRPGLGSRPPAEGERRMGVGRSGARGRIRAPRPIMARPLSTARLTQQLSTALAYRALRGPPGTRNATDSDPSSRGGEA